MTPDDGFTREGTPLECWERILDWCEQSVRFAADGTATNSQCLIVDTCDGVPSVAVCRDIDLGAWSWRYGDGATDTFQVGETEWVVSSSDDRLMEATAEGVNMRFSKIGGG